MIQKIGKDIQQHGIATTYRAFYQSVYLCEHITLHKSYIDGLAQDCGISSALALEIPQSYAKPSIYDTWYISMISSNYEL